MKVFVMVYMNQSGNIIIIPTFGDDHVKRSSMNYKKLTHLYTNAELGKAVKELIIYSQKNIQEKDTGKVTQIASGLKNYNTFFKNYNMIYVKFESEYEIIKTTKEKGRYYSVTEEDKSLAKVIPNDVSDEQLGKYIIEVFDLQKNHTKQSTIQNIYLDTINNKELPDCVGYKNAWMVFARNDMETVARALEISSYQEFTFDDGVRYLEEHKSNPNLVMICESCQGLIYAIGVMLSELSYDEEKLRNISTIFEKVYLFFTHRVSESHGFAIFHDGKRVREYYSDESRIIDFGNRTEAEKEFSFNFPHTIEEMFDAMEEEEDLNNENIDTAGKVEMDKNKITFINEEMIIQLSRAWCGFDMPYECNKVIIGNFGKPQFPLKQENRKANFISRWITKDKRL